MISCDLPAPEAEIAAKAVELPKGKVVLVHGIFDTRLGMRPLRKAIVAGGYECLVPSLKPVDGRKGLELLARQLADLIDQEWKDDAKFSIVAFSMGGLVSRYYLQKLGGAKRCNGLYTIATPHNGTYTAYLYPGKGAKQMRPESEFLMALKKDASVFENIPVTSYRNPLDVVMLPTKSPKWGKAENVRLWSAIHSSLLWEKELHLDLLKRLGKNSS
jgi:triacylglycerol lipase